MTRVTRDPLLDVEISKVNVIRSQVKTASVSKRGPQLVAPPVCCWSVWSFAGAVVCFGLSLRTSTVAFYYYRFSTLRLCILGHHGAIEICFIIIFLPSISRIPRGLKKIEENCRSDHYSGQSSNTKESCSSTPLIAAPARKRARTKKLSLARRRNDD